MRYTIWIVAAWLALLAVPAAAQSVRVLPGACPPGASALPPAGFSPLWMDSSGNLCISSGGGATGGALATTPAAKTLVTLDVKTVTTGGVAVTALTAGHRSAGGWIYNPSVATINLCINEIGTATGTTSSGDTTCILPGVTYTLQAASTAVSVISSDSSHPFSGMGLQ